MFFIEHAGVLELRISFTKKRAHYCTLFLCISSLVRLIMAPAPGRPHANTWSGLRLNKIGSGVRTASLKQKIHPFGFGMGPPRFAKGRGLGTLAVHR